MAFDGTRGVAVVAVTLQRVCHTTLIDWAKGDAAIARHTSSSVIFVSHLCCVALGALLAYSSGGVPHVRSCFTPKIFRKFIRVGVCYAVADILEMEAVGRTNAVAYTVLSQTSLAVKGLLVRTTEGTGQTSIQYLMLITTCFGILQYVFVERQALVGSAASVVGLLLALARVLLSCNVAVSSQEVLKEDPHAFPVQLTALKVSCASTTLVYMVAKDGLCGDGNGMFGEWSVRTVQLVVFGFVLKTIFNQYLLKFFDAVWKNVSDASCVVLVYFASLLFLGGQFDAMVFNAIVLVTASCISYILSRRRAASSRGDIDSELDVSAYHSARG